ncbi:hypothetical protein HRbin02_01083 [Candidatus Calditenuaceae archaeon HR02]|nr:hypothetical protein HRbin02_01083 [Candidatus Calditenuaceae archaeon HR02]
MEVNGVISEVNRTDLLEARKYCPRSLNGWESRQQKPFIYNVLLNPA